MKAKVLIPKGYRKMKESETPSHKDLKFDGHSITWEKVTADFMFGLSAYEIKTEIHITKIKRK